MLRPEVPRASLFRRRWTWILAIGVLGIASLAGITQGGSGSRGDPDPGGMILASLRSIEPAVPSGAAIGYVHRVEPYWDSCDGRAETEGWNDAVVQVGFGTTLNESATRDDVDRSLRSRGWTPLPTGQWTLSLSNGTTARATLDREPDSSWILIAQAPPVGRRVSGC